MGGNQALNINHTVADIDISTHASDWLWAVFAVMAVSDLAFIFLAFRAPFGQRAFFHIPVMLLTTASIAYFCMASDLGATPIVVEFLRGYVGNNAPTRSIWYVRYIDWTITTPLLLLEILLCTALPLSEIVTIIFMDIVMIVSGLVGALVHSTYKWGLFTFGCAALIYVWVSLLGPARTAAHAISPAVGSSFQTSALYLSGLWLLYPIAWGVADGGNVITPTSEMIFYGVLDVLAKPVFCAVHVYSLRNVDYSVFSLHSGKASNTAGIAPAGAATTTTAPGTSKVAANRDSVVTAA